MLHRLISKARVYSKQLKATLMAVTLLLLLGSIVFASSSQNSQNTQQDSPQSPQNQPGEVLGVVDNPAGNSPAATGGPGQPTVSPSPAQHQAQNATNGPTSTTSPSPTPTPAYTPSPSPSPISQSENKQWPLNPGSGGIVAKTYCVEKVEKVACRGGVIVKDMSGKEVLRMEADEVGSLTHYLAPGDYTVEALTSPANGSCAGFAQPPGSPPDPLCTNSYPIQIVTPEKITVIETDYSLVTVTYWDGRR